jgi:hypothetical protein
LDRLALRAWPEANWQQRRRRRVFGGLAGLLLAILGARRNRTTLKTLKTAVFGPDAERESLDNDPAEKWFV